MRLSEALGRQVVSTATAATVGKIDGFVVDPHLRGIVAVTLKKSSDGDALRWSDITAFGTDAVTVTDTDKLTATPPELADLFGKHHRLIGKRLLASTGDELGTVDDIEFDPHTGSITALVVAGADAGVSGDRLVGVGAYAVVVQAA